jgi:hypothetical protein
VRDIGSELGVAHVLEGSAMPIHRMSAVQRAFDNDVDFVTPLDMLAELRDDNKQLTPGYAKHTTCATSTVTLLQQA